MARARTLSNRIEAIEYVHADDGLPYRHAFKKGSTIRLEKDGSVKITNPSKKLWGMFDDRGAVKPYLINPVGRRTTTTRGRKMATRKKRRRRNMTALQRKYFGPKRRKSTTRRRRNPISLVSYTRKPKHVANPRRRRRRNPAGFSVSGILTRMKRGAFDALCVVGGELGATYASSLTSYADGSMMDTGVEVLASIGLGFAAEQVLGADRARFVLAGALSAPLKTLLKQANIPGITPLLGAAPNANTAVVYPSADGARMGAWAPGSRLGAWSPGAALAGRQSRAQLPASAAVLQS